MELRINRDVESHRDVRSAVSDGAKTGSLGNGEGNRVAQPSAAVSVEVARRKVEAENVLSASTRVRDPALAVQLARQIRTQITIRSEDAVRAQITNVTPLVLRALSEPDASDTAVEAGA
jgi:hypothetical protein